MLCRSFQSPYSLFINIGTIASIIFRTDGALLSKLSACSALVDDGLINLMPLGEGKIPITHTVQPAASKTDESRRRQIRQLMSDACLNTVFNGWNYSYKPCMGFNKPDNPYAGFGDTCLSVAICKYSELNDRAYYYTLGFNQNATFLLDKHSPNDDEEEDNKGTVKIMFEGFRSMKGKRTYIRLICDRKRKKAHQAYFRIIKDLPRRGDVEAELHHLCCCPNGCPLEITTSPSVIVNLSNNETEVVEIPAKKDDKIETDRTKVMIIVGVNLGVILLAGIVGLMCYNKRSHLEIYHKLPGVRATPDPAVWQIGNTMDLERGSNGTRGSVHSVGRPQLSSQSSTESVRATPDPAVWQIGNTMDLERGSNGTRGSVHSVGRPQLSSQSSTDRVRATPDPAVWQIGNTMDLERGSNGTRGSIHSVGRPQLSSQSSTDSVRATPDPAVWQIGNAMDLERGSNGTRGSVHSVGRPQLSSQSSTDSKSGYRDGEPNRRRKSLCFPVLEQINIPEAEINMRQRLGGGIFGDTYIGDWTGFTVSVKRITLSVHKYQTDPENIKGMEEEVLYMSQQRHRNIVSVLGFCSESKHPYIVSDFIKGQVVKDLVKNSGENLSWHQRVKMLSQVADGMAFLHSNKPPILHRDLRCGNLFITNNEVMKICDFGIVKLTQPLRAKCKEEDCCCQGLYSACPPSIGWTAPEVLQHPNSLEADGHITIFCDVYSYAIVMWELITGDDPFEEFHTAQEVIDHVIGGGRPELHEPSLMFPVYVELMQKLWVASPTDRLTFKQITVQLKEISHQAKVFQKMLNNKQQTANKSNAKSVSFSEGTKDPT